MKSDIPREPTIADQAAEWLATLTDASCTNDERQGFVQWLKSSNLHVDEFLRISALTQRLTRSGAWPRKDIEALIAEATVARASMSGLSQRTERTERSKAEAPRDRAQRRGMLSRPAWMLATCGVAAIAVVTAVLLKLGPLDFTGKTYATAIGELRSLTLEDGSVVELNTNSRLRARFTEAQRDVQLLRGEAVFKVAKNPHRPFRVSSGSIEIVAVGTEFNVYARAAQTVVTVLEGRVRVTDRPRAASIAAGERKLELTVGEQAVIAPHLPIERVKLADSRQVTSWTERRLIFEDTPLAAAADEFARYNARSIRIADPELRNLRVSGVFDATDPASLVQFVAAYGNVNARENEAGWTLYVP